jgi:hypothetical protein
VSTLNLHALVREEILSRPLTEYGLVSLPFEDLKLVATPLLLRVAIEVNEFLSFRACLNMLDLGVLACVDLM